MKNLSLKFLVMALCAGSIFLGSCSNDDEEPDGPVVISPTTKGVFVTNEGQFMQGNGSVSYLNLETKAIQKNVFQDANGRPLGDVVQSMGMANDKAYLVVNNSNKIEIVEAGTFKSTGVINNLKLPRYFAAVGQKGYVTEWVGFSGNGQVSVVDLNTNTVTKTITVGALPDRMLVIGTKIYVANSDGNTLSVINTQTDAVESTITVGDGPNSMALDASNKLWVLCGGKKVYDPVTYLLDLNASTAGSLVQVNLSSNSLEKTMTFAGKEGLPSDLNCNAAKTSFVYNYLGKVYRIDQAASTLPANALINRSFYGLGVDPINNSIFGTDAGSFSGNGKLIMYTPAGLATDSFTVGIGPNNFFFK